MKSTYEIFFTSRGSSTVKRTLTRSVSAKDAETALRRSLKGSLSGELDKIIKIEKVN